MDPGPPELRASSNDLVLDTIFKHLSTSSLLNCRFVSPKWNKIASNILKRRCTCIRISSWAAQNLKKLSQTLSNNKNDTFPATGLKLSTRPTVTLDLESAATRQFLMKFGSMFTYVHVKKLKLKDNWQMIYLFQDCLPRTAVLVLKSLTASEFIGEVDWEFVRLPLLKRIELEEDYHVDHDYLIQLIYAAENLKQIGGVAPDVYDNPYILKELREQNQLRMITSLTLRGTIKELNNEIEQLALQPPPVVLTELTLEGPWRGSETVEAFQRCVKALLIASENILKKLAFARLNIPWEELPVVFTKLHTMEVGMVDCNVTGLVPPGFTNLDDSSQKFPALKKISLALPKESDCRSHTLTGTEEILKKHYWKPGTVWKSVDTIELHNHFRPDGFQYLAKVFPNVTQVIFNMTSASFASHDAEARKPSHVWHVREFKSLQRLVIKDFPCADNTSLYLDTFLTGIPLASCKNLSKISKQRLDPGLNKIIRPYGGLFKLQDTGLQQLEISYRSDGQFTTKYHFMSVVSAWYGLELIPGLQTTLKIPFKAKTDFEQFLEPLRPYAAVEYYWD